MLSKTEAGTSRLQVSLLKSEKVRKEKLKSVYLHLLDNIMIECTECPGDPRCLKTLEKHNTISLMLRDEASHV